MRKVAIVTGVAAAAVVLAGAAAASPVYCGPRQAMLTKLADSLHEQPSSIALTSDGQILEVLKSDADLAWAILITTPQGLSCVIAEGESWQSKKLDRVVEDPQM
jgi:hypothetical protein